jgi:ribonuclease BN (tRNA processing enzyme)
VFRFDIDNGKSIVFSGDTVRSDNMVRLAADCDLLVHEAIFPAPQGKTGQPASPRATNPDYMRLSHTTPQEVGSVAHDAGARSVVLSHISPADLPDEQCKAAVSTNYRGPVSVASDLRRFPLD